MESPYSKSEVRVLEILANNLTVKEQSVINFRINLDKFRKVGEEKWKVKTESKWSIIEKRVQENSDWVGLIG